MNKKIIIASFLVAIVASNNVNAAESNGDYVYITKEEFGQVEDNYLYIGDYNEMFDLPYSFKLYEDQSYTVKTGEGKYLGLCINSHEKVAISYTVQEITSYSSSLTLSGGATIDVERGLKIFNKGIKAFGQVDYTFSRKWTSDDSYAISFKYDIPCSEKPIKYYLYDTEYITNYIVKYVDNNQEKYLLIRNHPGITKKLGFSTITPKILSPFQAKCY